MHEHERERAQGEQSEIEAEAAEIRRRWGWGAAAVVAASALTLLPGGVEALLAVVAVVAILWAARRVLDTHGDSAAAEWLREHRSESREREPREGLRKRLGRRRAAGHVPTLPDPREPWRSERWISERVEGGLAEIERFLQTQT